MVRWEHLSYSPRADVRTAQCHLPVRTARHWELKRLHPVAVHAGRERPASLGLTAHEFGDVHTFSVQRPAQMLHQHGKILRADCLRNLPDDLEEAAPLVADLLP